LRRSLTWVKKIRYFDERAHRILICRSSIFLPIEKNTKLVELIRDKLMEMPSTKTSISWKITPWTRCRKQYDPGLQKPSIWIQF
jgi:hypothetical protein